MGHRITADGVLIVIFCCCALVLTSTAADDILRVKRSGKPRQCRDKFEIIPNHTMCIRQTRPQYNKTVQATIEDLHNKIRENVNPPASNMMKMAYIRTLELEAQTWAENCQFYHDDPYKRFIPDRYNVGQNILINPGKDLSWAKVINTWASENTNFHYNKPGNSVAGVGNYTQMVWAETNLVGCGKAKCGTTYFYVCNYAPSMDVRRLDTPYEKTAPGQPAGHKCGGNHPPNSTLCDCSGKYCLNGGRLDLTTCNCVCVAGVGMYDASRNCEMTCIANGDHASCKSLTKQSCETDPQTAFSCPWLCHACPYAGMKYREGSVPMPWETTTTSQITTTPRRNCVAVLSPSTLVVAVVEITSISVMALKTFL